MDNSRLLCELIEYIERLLRTQTQCSRLSLLLRILPGWASGKEPARDAADERVGPNNNPAPSEDSCLILESPTTNTQRHK